MDELHQKKAVLLERLKNCGSVAVAFSAGVDSAFLLACAAQTGIPVLAVTLSANAVPRRELEAAAAFCRERGIPQRVIEFDQFTIPAFVTNAKDRCYHCKKALFTAVKAAAAEAGCRCVLEGSNADDALKYRPGMKAVEELGVLSPLREAGLAKAEIRALSAEMGLPTTAKPSMSCLATRFPYGQTLTRETLAAVEAGEAYLFSLGLRQVRLRVHGDVARIEVLPADFAVMTARDTAEQTVRRLCDLGFRHVTLDLQGFRSGSMDE